MEPTDRSGAQTDMEQLRLEMAVLKQSLEEHRKQSLVYSKEIHEACAELRAIARRTRAYGW